MSLGLRIDAGEPIFGGEPELVFSVSDTGPGIPGELRERIFYPFFTTKQRGSGVGLAQAQKIVAGHGGRIELESDVGHGATFRVRLPIEPGEGAARLRLATRETGSSTPGGASSSISATREAGSGASNGRGDSFS